MQFVKMDNAVFTVPDNISMHRVSWRLNSLHNYYHFCVGNPNWYNLIEQEVNQLVRELKLLGVGVSDNFAPPLDVPPAL